MDSLFEVGGTGGGAHVPLTNVQICFVDFRLSVIVARLKLPPCRLKS
jgi:hypothetical protein